MAKHRTHSVEFKRQVSQEYVGGETCMDFDLHVRKAPLAVPVTVREGPIRCRPPSVHIRRPTAIRELLQ